MAQHSAVVVMYALVNLLLVVVVVQRRHIRMLREEIRKR